MCADASGCGPVEANGHAFFHQVPTHCPLVSGDNVYDIASYHARDLLEIMCASFRVNSRDKNVEHI